VTTNTWDESQPSESSVRLATLADRAGVVATVVAAFATDPAFRYFFPEAEHYEQQASVFAGLLFDKRIHNDGIWVSEGCEATAMWNVPNAEATSRKDVPSRDQAFQDLGAVADRIRLYDDPVVAAMPSEPHWYLGILACHPDHQGRALARQVSQAGLGQAAAQGFDAYLETANPANVSMYERSGWRVTHEIVPVPELPTWIMCHEPTGPDRRSDKQFCS
jgi:GNAT superfamily N-acetyltransferase